MNLLDQCMDEFWRPVHLSLASRQRMRLVVLAVSQEVFNNCPADGAQGVAIWLLEQANQSENP